MINSITMRQCATYDAEGVSIDNCPKINFIYGPNGSGKSTISNYLQNTSEAMYSKRTNPSGQPSLCSVDDRRSKPYVPIT